MEAAPADPDPVSSAGMENELAELDDELPDLNQ